ncbi:hypothetical protein NSERUTF1_4918 [Nocardia seriolae]|nr:hypothetical protein NSERUTF1_4918 [Nocardia seriolae]
MRAVSPEPGKTRRICQADPAAGGPTVLRAARDRRIRC